MRAMIIKRMNDYISCSVYGNIHNVILKHPRWCVCCYHDAVLQEWQNAFM